MSFHIHSPVLAVLWNIFSAYRVSISASFVIVRPFLFFTLFNGFFLFASSLMSGIASQNFILYLFHFSQKCSHYLLGYFIIFLYFLFFYLALLIHFLALKHCFHKKLVFCLFLQSTMLSVFFGLYFCWPSSKLFVFEIIPKMLESLFLLN